MDSVLEVSWPHVVRCALTDFLAIALVDLCAHSFYGVAERQGKVWAAEAAVLTCIGSVVFQIHHTPTLIAAAIVTLLWKCATAAMPQQPMWRSPAMAVSKPKKQASPPRYRWTSESDDELSAALRTSPAQPDSSRNGQRPGVTAGHARRTPASKSASVDRRPVSTENATRQSTFSYADRRPDQLHDLTGMGITPVPLRTSPVETSGYRPWGLLRQVSSCLSRGAFSFSLSSMPYTSSIGSDRFPNPSVAGTESAVKGSCDDLSFVSSDHRSVPVVAASSPHPPGLPNSGRNICFLNSTVQCLARCPGLCQSLASCLSRSMPDVDPARREFLSRSVELLRACRKPAGGDGPGILDTSGFRATVSALPRSMVAHPDRSLYAQRQCDASEFLLWLFDLWHLSTVEFPASAADLKELSDVQVDDAVRRAVSGVDARSGLRSVSPQLSALSATALERLIVRCRDAERRCDAATAGDTTVRRRRRRLACLATDCERRLFPASALSECVSLQLVAEHGCQQCHRAAVRTEPCSILSVPLPPAATAAARPVPLAACLEHYSRVEQLDKAARNGVRCECGSGDAGYRQMLRSPPPVLVVQLLRFEYAHAQRTTNKVSVPVMFPISGLSLDNVLLHNDDVPSGRRGESPVYDLCAVCAHAGSGSAAYGHYVAYCRECDGGGGAWYKYDDEKVTAVHDMQAELCTTFLLTSSYMLFYSRR